MNEPSEAAATSREDAGDPPAGRRDRLLGAAAAARRHAHVPYSGFDAGAAVLDRDGAVITGSVVENISLGLAMCAERVALFATISAGRRPQALALVAPVTGGERTLPCGACLQVALELGGPGMEIFARSPDEDGPGERHLLRDLLPRGPHRRPQR